MDIRYVATWTPIRDLRDMQFVRNAATWGAPMANDTEVCCAQNHLESRKRATAIFHALYNVIDIVQVLPNEAANAGVFHDHLVGAVSVTNTVDPHFCFLFSSMFHPSYP